MSPQLSDPNSTSPINRDELRALLRRARDIEAHDRAADVHARRGVKVVVNRNVLNAWLHEPK